MNIVLIHGQNHKGSSYHIGRMIADKIDVKKEITEFFCPKTWIIFVWVAISVLRAMEIVPSTPKRKSLWMP